MIYLIDTVLQINIQYNVLNKELINILNTNNGKQTSKQQKQNNNKNRQMNEWLNGLMADWLAARWIYK